MSNAEQQLTQVREALKICNNDEDRDNLLSLEIDLKELVKLERDFSSQDKEATVCRIEAKEEKFYRLFFRHTLIKNAVLRSTSRDEQQSPISITTPSLVRSKQKQRKMCR